MALIKLLILDDDDEYSFNLCNYLTHHYSETRVIAKAEVVILRQPLLLF